MLENGDLAHVKWDTDYKGSFSYSYSDQTLTWADLSTNRIPSGFHFHRRVVFFALANYALSLGAISKTEYGTWLSEIGELDK